VEVLPLTLVRAGVFTMTAGFANAVAAFCIDQPFLTSTIRSKTLTLCLGDGTATYSFGT
jgi:hypothetical protein